MVGFREPSLPPAGIRLSDFSLDFSGRTITIKKKAMSPHTTVSIHPYSTARGQTRRVHRGHARLRRAHRSEETVLFYDFTVCDGIVFCREA